MTLSYFIKMLWITLYTAYFILDVENVIKSILTHIWTFCSIILWRSIQGKSGHPTYRLVKSPLHVSQLTVLCRPKDLKGWVDSGGRGEGAVWAGRGRVDQHIRGKSCWKIKTKPTKSKQKQQTRSVPWADHAELNGLGLNVVQLCTTPKGNSNRVSLVIFRGISGEILPGCSDSGESPNNPPIFHGISLMVYSVMEYSVEYENSLIRLIFLPQCSNCVIELDIFKQYNS